MSAGISVSVFDSAILSGVTTNVLAVRIGALAGHDRLRPIREPQASRPGRNLAPGGRHELLRIRRYPRADEAEGVFLEAAGVG